MPDPNAPLVLVVDDEAPIRRAVAFLLTRAGYRVREAANGADARAAAGEERPDLVVLDVMMPGEDGFATALAMRRDPALEDLPILFLTARGADADRASGYRSGADDYLVKPFDNDDLLDRVRDLLGG